MVSRRGAARFRSVAVCHPRRSPAIRYSPVGLVRHRTALKNRIHATLLTFGHPCPVSDLFGTGGRELLARLELPEPWAADTVAALHLIDELDHQIVECERALRRMGADHRYVPLLMTTPGVGWVLGYTIAAEIGDISRFPSPTKLAGYTGLCPRVYQSGGKGLLPAAERADDGASAGADVGGMSRPRRHGAGRGLVGGVAGWSSGWRWWGGHSAVTSATAARVEDSSTMALSAANAATRAWTARLLTARG